jgi:hypothetical protein
MGAWGKNLAGDGGGALLKGARRGGNRGGGWSGSGSATRCSVGVGSGPRLRGGTGVMEAGNDRTRDAEQRSGERIEAGTGAVATWRRREGGPVDQRTTPDRHQPQCRVVGRTGEGKGGLASGPRP